MQKIDSMIPGHCAEVGIKEVDFPLSEEKLIEYFVGRQAYTRTRYYAVTNGKDWAVTRIFKTETPKLFHRIERVELLSGPERTHYHREPNLDVLQLGALLRIQADHPDDLVIVEGRFEHVSFVDIRTPSKIRIVDVVPPRPSKLECLLKDITGSCESILDISCSFLDISDLLANIDADESVMLPCRSSYQGIEGELGKGEVLYLDQTPQLTEDALKSIKLIGCSLSENIFREIYGVPPVMRNICPKEISSSSDTETPTIARCCKVKGEPEVSGRSVYVPWGVSICEAAEALRIALNMTSS